MENYHSMSIYINVVLPISEKQSDDIGLNIFIFGLALVIDFRIYSNGSTNDINVSPDVSNEY